MKDLVEQDAFVDNFMEALMAIDRKQAKKITDEYYAAHNCDKRAIIELATVTLEKVGIGWEDGSVSLAQVYMGSKICEEIFETYFDEVPRSYEPNPVIAIGVLLDHHALGKKMVSTIAGISGYSLIDLGVGLEVDDMVKGVVVNKVDILLVSTLMLPSALKVKEVKRRLMDEGVSVKIVVGGAPFRLNQLLWIEVGADDFGNGAEDITKILERMVNHDSFRKGVNGVIS